MGAALHLHKDKAGLVHVGGGVALCTRDTPPPHHHHHPRGGGFVLGWTVCSVQPSRWHMGRGGRTGWLALLTGGFTEVRQFWKRRVGLENDTSDWKTTRRWTGRTTTATRGLESAGGEASCSCHMTGEATRETTCNDSLFAVRAHVMISRVCDSINRRGDKPGPLYCSENF